MRKKKIQARIFVIIRVWHNCHHHYPRSFQTMRNSPFLWIRKKMCFHSTFWEGAGRALKMLHFFSLRRICHPNFLTNLDDPLARPPMTSGVGLSLSLLPGSLKIALLPVFSFCKLRMWRQEPKNGEVTHMHYITYTHTMTNNHESTWKWSSKNYSSLGAN